MSGNTRLFFIAGLLIAAGLALLVSPLASSEPDGLGKVAEDHGFAAAERESDLAGDPLAGYAVRGIDDPWWSKGLSGVIGVMITFGVGLGLFTLMRALRPRHPRPVEKAT